MVATKRNRRVRKTLNKFYRHQQADLWGRVASSNKLNNTSKYLYYAHLLDLTRHLKQLSPDNRISLMKKMNLGKEELLTEYPNSFLIQHQGGPRKRKRHLTLGGFLLKMKRKLSLFYGRIRRHQLRKLSTLAKNYRFDTTDRYNGLAKNATMGSLMERRIDCVLFRSNFCKSIFEARQLITHGKVLVGNHKVTAFAQHLPNFVPLTLVYSYRVKRKEELLELIYNNKIALYPPKYLFVDYILMLAIIIRHPANFEIKYPTPELGMEAFKGLSRFY